MLMAKSRFFFSALFWLLPFCTTAHGQQALRQTLVQRPPADLTRPAPGARYIVPVVSICYLPTPDGVNMTKGAVRSPATLEAMYDRILLMTRQIKFSLEEGSHYHGYRSPGAPPSLGYKVVAMITVTEVDNQGIKEFWVWSYHYGDLEVAESNMSSPITGDTSNSERRNDDLPIFYHTYVVYNYNYERSTAEAVHDHGHQLEGVLKYVNKNQDGNTRLEQ